ncbi:PAB-dependent poly(A)-specific ribonuclease subunit PAN3 [Yarrowia sp. B02]|nr:PAB-dependent poly(A)-specific ribonuclease subunit PAN3 [Yarrowia sp. B02]
MPKFNINSPSFTPSVVDKSSMDSHSAAAAPAAPFVPGKSPIDLEQIKSKLTISKDKKEGVKVGKLNPAVAGFTPGGASGSTTPKTATAPAFQPTNAQVTQNQSFQPGAASFQPRFQAPSQIEPGYDNYYDEMSNGAVMAAAQNQQFPLQYHLYAPHYLSASRQRQLLAHQKTAKDFFLDPQLHQRLHKQSEDLLKVEGNSNLPRFVDKYHSLVLLDSNLNSKENGAQGESPQWVYKCMNGKDGKQYALRRIQGFVLTNEQAMASVRKWQSIVHPAFVSLCEAFTTRDFGDASLCMIYDFFPSAETLFDLLNRGHHFSRDVIISYLLQLLSVLDTIHSAGLAAKTVDPTKILVCGPGRVRLNCCGLYDVINFDKDENVTLFQQQDLRNLGLLVLCLACNSVEATKNVEQSLQRLDSELQEIVQYLLSSNTSKTASRVLASLTPLLTATFNESLNTNDALEHELRRELENGRLVRLMAKLNFITERPGPDPEMSQQWSETGDRYLIKLFRDYVFHQQDELGKPVMDLGHVVRTLNKLDAGIDERITLISRNGQNCLIVSYKDLKQCIESALRDLE